MDFLLALVAPILTKVLYFAYLSGVATAYHLRLGNKKRAKGLPVLPPQRLRSRASFGEAKPQVGPTRALQTGPVLLGAICSATYTAAARMATPVLSGVYLHAASCAGERRCEHSAKGTS